MPLLPPSDARLVQQALAADAGAFEWLVRRHQKRAHAVARAAGLRGGSVDDAVQEAFIAAFRGLGKLKEPTGFGRWLLGIVRNVARKRLAADGRATASLELGVEPAAPEAAAAGVTLEQRELSELLWRRVAELPPSLREAVYLYYHEGESVRAVAAALGISRDAVKTRLLRGREALREELWRELGQSLRDLLPAARDWKVRGRRLTLLVLAAAVPARSAAATSAAGTSALAAGTAGILATYLGGIIVGAKQAGLAATIAVTVLGAAGALFLLSPPGDELTAPQPVAAAPAAAGAPLAATAAPAPPQGAAASLPEDAGPAVLRFELRDLRTHETIKAGRAELTVEPAGAAEVAVRDGQIEARLAAPNSTAALGIRVRGYAEATVEIAAAEASPADTPAEPIDLDPGICISGKVVDKGIDESADPEKLDREPVPGAAVTALRVATTRHQALEDEPVSETRTDGAGVFRLTGIQPGERIVLRAEAPGRSVRYQEVPLPTGEDARDILIELSPGFTLRGSVVAEDAALAGLLTRAKLTLRVKSPERWPSSLAAERTLEIAGDGGEDGIPFVIDGLPAGQCRLDAEPEDVAFSRDNRTEPFAVGAGAEDAEVLVVAGSARTIDGTVVTSEGKPFAGALACLQEPGGGDSLFCEQTRADGSFALHRARRGKAYGLWVFAPNAKERLYEVTRDADAYVLDPSPPQESVRLAVTFRGEDISSSSLSFTFFDSEEPSSGGGGGGFVPASHRLPLGDKRTFVFYGRFQETQLAPRRIDLRQHDGQDLELAMEEGATLRGSVVTDDGKPVQAATVKVTARDLCRWQATAQTGVDGTFELKGLPLDPASLEIAIEDAGEWRPREELKVASYAAPARFVLVREPVAEAQAEG